MMKNKIGKLPLVENGKLVGLYSFTDVQHADRERRAAVQPRRPVPPARRRRRRRPTTRSASRSWPSSDVDVVVVDTRARPLARASSR